MSLRHLWIVLLFFPNLVFAQAKTTAEQAVEGGKLLVELIKVLNPEKGKAANQDCKGRHADFCVINNTQNALTVTITSRTTEEKRELVITTETRECCLQVPIGVWTYAIRISGSIELMRKGDLLIEGCNNMNMTIK
jgi:hypothetical protein